MDQQHLFNIVYKRDGEQEVLLAPNVTREAGLQYIEDRILNGNLLGTGGFYPAAVNTWKCAQSGCVVQLRHVGSGDSLMIDALSAVRDMDEAALKAYLDKHSLPYGDQTDLPTLSAMAAEHALANAQTA